MAHNVGALQSLVAQKLPADTGAVRTALDATLRRKGLVLDVLSRERAALLTSDNPQAAAARGLQGVCSRLASLTLAGPGKLPPDVYRGRLKELEVEKERLEKELSHLSGAYAAERRSRQVDSEGVARALKPGSVLVEYVVSGMFDFRATGTQKKWGADRYLAYVLPAGQQARPVLVDLGEAEPIDRSVRDFRQEVARAPELIPRLGEAEAERQLSEKGKRVYALVIAPLKAVVGESRVLRQVEWPALPGTRREAEAIVKELSGQQARLYLRDQIRRWRRWSKGSRPLASSIWPRTDSS